MGHVDLIMGFSTGEIIWFEPISQKYTRLNKNVCNVLFYRKAQLISIGHYQQHTRLGDPMDTRIRELIPYRTYGWVARGL
jgi:hypothetical protein